MYFLYVAVCREEGAKLFLRGLEIQVADVNIFHGKPTFLECLAQVGQCVLPPGQALPIQRGCTFRLPEPRRISMMHKNPELLCQPQRVHFGVLRACRQEPPCAGESARDGAACAGPWLRSAGCARGSRRTTSRPPPACAP